MSHHNRQLQRQRGTLRISIFEILAVLYIAHKVIPVVGYYMPSVAYLGLFGLVAVLLLPMFRYKTAWTISGFFAISLLTLFTRLKSLSGGALYLYGELQIYLYGIIALRLIVAGDKKACRRVFAIIFAMYVITAVTTILGNEKYPQASRMLATLPSSDYYYREYVKENIGSFAFVYELVLLTPLLMYLTRSKTIKPILGYGLIILVGVTIFATEYGMAVMLFAASLLLLLPKLTTKKLIILLVIILVVFIVGSELMAEVFENLSLNVESETLAERFLIVAETLRGEDELSGATGESRMQLYTKSLESFLETNLLGRWGSGGIGGHSYVFDALGNFGLLGLLGVTVIFITIHGRCLKPYRNEAFYPYLVWISIAGVVLMFLNPKVYPFIFLCVLPLFGTAFKAEKRSEDNESSLDRE